MNKCIRCGSHISEEYTYCKRCYIAAGSPKGLVVNKPHKCRKCGTTITGRYHYCFSCAKSYSWI